ncbi:MAG: hypothetical protein LBI02_00130, partial [Opitutaceae bacterium]|nr:hypothetical protein [Opitutaceae bacterium]
GNMKRRERQFNQGLFNGQGHLMGRMDRERLFFISPSRALPQSLNLRRAAFWEAASKPGIAARRKVAPCIEGF